MKRKQRRIGNHYFCRKSPDISAMVESVTNSEDITLLRFYDFINDNRVNQGNLGNLGNNKRKTTQLIDSKG